ncbi:MAG: hypothetical protein A3H35_04375 [Betaproteobacteria bacterium RIFCSPLOWO2_02_FULL_62_17]|nr:MAG: hypothetical protein A3H35_04375 [Betaproteobacteria bacterium RIFCSPLOWO2_02_FULL_62_17]
MKAELILTNARIAKTDGATEIAVGRGRVIAVGRGLIGGCEPVRGAQILDCRGGTVMPGFIDAHLHFISFADSLLSVDLRPRTGIRSIEGIQAALRRQAEATPRGEWLKAKGYDEFRLVERRHPTRWDLDEAAPHHPVRLSHRSLHAHVLNSLALKFLGIDLGTPDPAGGMIERDLTTGEPTGLLYEMGDVLARRVPRWPTHTFERAVKQAGQELAECGITTFLDASPTIDPARRKVLQDYKARGLIRQRVSMMMGREALPELGPRSSFASEHDGVAVWGIKAILDRTTGTPRPCREELIETIQTAHRSGWPVAIHAVEEETLEAALDAFEAVLGTGPSTAEPAHRIEHGSVCPPYLARRIAALGITVATQPSFIHYHGSRYLASIPAEQHPYLYPLASWLRSGVHVAGSSDCPLVPPSPLMGIHAAVNRSAKNGDVVSPGEEISVDEAISMYTISAARTLGLPSVSASLAPGQAADLVVLSHDPASVAADELQDIKVRLTMIGGETVWRAADL